VPTPDAFFTFSILVMLIVASPGPNLFLLLRTTPALGRAAGMANTFGFCAAIMSHAFLSLIGVGALIATSALAFTLLKAFGALYLSWLGIRALRSAWQGPTLTGPNTFADRGYDKTGKTRAQFVEGYLTNILNPKPALFYIAAFPQDIAVGGQHFLLQGAALGTVHAMIALTWYILIVFGIAAVSKWMQRPSIWRTIQGLSGAVLIFLGLRLILIRQVN